MAFDISVKLNFPRTQKVADAFCAYHAGHGLSFSRLIGMPGGTNQYVASELPPEFWQEANTGVVMLRPYFMRQDRIEHGASSFYAKGDLVSGGTTLYADPSSSLIEFNLSTQGPTSVAKSIVAGLKSGDDERKDLTGLPPQLISWRDQFAPDLVWNIRTTDPLAPNQSFQYTCDPSGIYTDFSGTYKAIGFGGGGFVLEIQMYGDCVVYGWNGAAWQSLLEVTPGEVGINARNPFTVSVVPFSRRFLSVSFGQAGSVPQQRRSGGKSRSYNFDNSIGQRLVILRGGNFEPPYDASHGQYIKTGAGQIYLLLKKQRARYDFALARGIYPTGTTTLSLAPETMDKAPTWALDFNTTGLKTRGVDGQREPSGGTATQLTTFLRDIHGNAYSTTFTPGLPPDPRKQVAVPEVGFTPSQNGIYTPELHAASLKHGAHVQTAGFTPLDVSDKWQLLRGQITTEAEVSRIEMKLKDDSRWQEMLKADGPFRITAKDNSGVVRTIADGYLRRKQIGREGPSQLTTNQAEGLDMWFRLDAASFSPEAVEGSEIADTIRKAILDAGFGPDEVWVDYAGSPELRDMTFGNLRNPSDVLRPNEDTSVGAFVRDCVSKYGAQERPGLRVRWVKAPTGMTPPTGNLWKIYLGPIYDPTVGPECVFTFDSSIVPLLGTFASQTERYQGRVYLAHGTQEPTTLQPEFNAVKARAAADVTGHDANPERFVDAEDRVLDDPTYVGYEGAKNVKILGPSDFPGVTSADDLERQIRRYFDLHYNLKSLRTHEFSAEWQPETDVDQFAAVVGLAPANDPGGRFVKGDPISYGAFRIDFIDWEIRHDGPTPSGSSRRWEWEGSYKLVYVGKWEMTGATPIRMFAPDSLLPL